MWSQGDSSLLLDFHAINHGEINKVLLVVFSSHIMTCLNIVQSCTVSILHSSNNTQFTSSNNTQFTSSNNTQFTSSNNTQFTSSVHTTDLHGASFLDNSLPRCTLHTSSVQDLHPPPRFLFQRQSYACCQGMHLRAII